MSYFQIYQSLQQTHPFPHTLLHKIQTQDQQKYPLDTHCFDTFHVQLNLTSSQQAKLKSISQEQIQTKYLQAFFRQPIFQLERLLLKLFISKSEKTTDKDILNMQFQQPEKEGVSMFRLQERRNLYLLEQNSCIYEEALFEWDKDKGRTWLGTGHFNSSGATANKINLYFGSGLRIEEARKPGFIFHNILHPFHRLYSKILVIGAGHQFAKDIDSMKI